MRLYELLEQDFPEIKYRAARDKVPDLYAYSDPDSFRSDDDVTTIDKHYAENPNVTKLGMGAFSTAYQHKHSPHDVVKGSKLTAKPDGFEAFFMGLSEHPEMQTNPYFPRFRNINRFKAKGKQQTSYMVRVETLEKLKVLSNKESEMLFDKIFTDEGKKFVEEKLHKWDLNPKKWSYLTIGLEFLVTDTALLEDVKDEHLLQAMDFLQELSEKYNYDIDLHDENIMIRRTSVGPQLVLNDPLGFSSDE